MNVFLKANAALENIKILQKSIDELQLRLAQSDNEVVALRDRMNQIEADRTELYKKNNERTAFSVEQSIRIDHLETEKNRLFTSTTQLSDDCAILFNKVEVLECDRTKLFERLDQLHAGYHNRTVETERLRIDTCRLDGQVYNLNNRTNKIEEAVTNVQITSVGNISPDRKKNIQETATKTRVLNIVFSTTRQWNPGDEIILKGILNLFSSMGISVNPIIYNRNPDVRSQFHQLFKTSKVPAMFNRNEETIAAEANLKFGMFDNSVKPDMDLSFVDWVIFAGTPEWCNGRNLDIYHLIFKYNLPVMILGVGGGWDCFDNRMNEVIAKAAALTVRESTTKSELEKKGYKPIYVPCPALLSVDDSCNKRIEVVKRIGLIYQASQQESVIWNGSSMELNKFQNDLFNKLLEVDGQYYQFSIVCHYIDEIPLAIRDFPGIEVIYSYDANHYFDIYGKFDLIIGSRVHGIGVAASMGIPGIAVIHDARGETCQGFLAECLTLDTDLDASIEIISNVIANVKEYNSRLLSHKKEVLHKYQVILANALKNDQVEYSIHSLVDYQKFSLNDVADDENYKKFLKSL